VPLDIAAIAGRTHVVAALGTADARVAKIKSARLFLSLATILETMRVRMARALDIDGTNDSRRLEMLAAEAFALGQEYEARKENLKQEFSVRLSQMIASLKDDASRADAPPSICEGVDGVISFATARERIAAPAGPAFTMPWPIAAAASASPAWTTLKQAFLNDKPGLTEKTLWSYNQAFDAWEALIGGKPISDIRRPDVKAFADFLRDKVNPRGGKLDHKTIQRSLGHIKTFMAWAVAAGHVVDDRFETVAGRDMNKEEQLAGDRRRAFTAEELKRLFESQLLIKPCDDSEVAACWFLAIAALTGARTEEIALAPAKLVLLGNIHCLDLREAGRKTSAAPRLIPLLPDLIKMELVEWAAKQEARGYSLVQPGAEQRTAAAWSKRLNRYLNAKVSDDQELVLYSLRHSFRQMLRAGNIGDELADKIFGHSTGKVGAGYGRDLSPGEAQLFIDNVKPPVDLRHLWRGG
jgi:integrase